MKTAELRKKWIRSIGNVDERFLRMIDALYESYVKTEDVDKNLPDVARKLIEQSLNDIENGRVFSHEEVMAEYKQKYSG